MTEAGSERRVDDGFTLIEVTVAVAILALAATLATPLVRQGLRAIEFRAAVTEAATVLRMARADAARSSSERVVTIDLQRREIAGPAPGKRRRLPKSVAWRFESENGLRSEADAIAIRFRPDGGASGGRLIASMAADQAVIAVDWLTGQSRIAWGRR